MEELFGLLEEGEPEEDEPLTLEAERALPGETEGAVPPETERTAPAGSERTAASGEMELARPDSAEMPALAALEEAERALPGRAEMAALEAVGRMDAAAGGTGTSGAAMEHGEALRGFVRRAAGRTAGSGDVAERLVEAMAAASAGVDGERTAGRVRQGMDWPAGGRPAGYAAEDGARTLYSRVNAARLRAVERGSGDVILRVNEIVGESARSAAADARTLDRAFQRDARRYDGGLSLL